MVVENVFSTKKKKIFGISCKGYFIDYSAQTYSKNENNKINYKMKFQKIILSAFYLFIFVVVVFCLKSLKKTNKK